MLNTTFWCDPLWFDSFFKSDASVCEKTVHTSTKALDDGSYCLCVDVPGVKKDDVKLTLEDGELKLRTKREDVEKTYDVVVNKKMLDVNTVSARIENGVLVLTFLPVKKDVREIVISA